MSFCYRIFELKGISMCVLTNIEVENNHLLLSTCSFVTDLLYSLLDQIPDIYFGSNYHNILDFIGT